MMRRGARAARTLFVVGLSGCATHGGTSRMAPTQTAAPVATDAGGRELLGADRIAKLPDTVRADWMAYVEHSQALHALDTAAMNAELRAAGLTSMTKAPYSAPDFALAREKSDDWFRSGDAREIADAVITFQTPSGGWSKRTAMTRARRTGESYYSETEAWHYIPTLDNGATNGQLRFLSRVIAAQPDVRYVSAYRRGLDYLLAAQQPNGCWPQDFPLDGGYHDAITFNDDAVVNTLETLDEAAAGQGAATPQQQLAAAAAKRGVDCIVAIQVVMDGHPTVWGQQHDPITLDPVPARRYELAGLAGRESAAVMTYLMTLPNPDQRVVRAVHAAADWFRANAIMGYSYDFREGLAARAGAGPIWARLTEIGTRRPIFANRDGVKLYDWNKLTDRRTGYAWFGTEPAAALRKYDRWSRTHPRP